MKRLAECERQLSEFNFPRQSAAGQIPAENLGVLGHLVEEASPPSAFVVGGDEATIALVTKTGASVLAIDRDERRVDAIYEKARTHRADILPLVMDLRYPGPGYGVQNAVLAPALTRLRCDLVVALGLIDSLVFAQRLQFEQIAGTFAELALRTLIVEFPPPQNPRVIKHLRDPYFAWFSLDRFIAVLEKYFRSVRAERPANGAGTLLVCKKIAH